MVATASDTSTASTGSARDLASGYDPAVYEDRRVVLTAYVQDRIDRWRKEDPPRTYQWIADALGCSKAHVISIHLSEKGVGAGVEDMIARRLFSGSHDDFFETAREWWRTGGEGVYRRRVPATDEERSAKRPGDSPEFVRAIASGSYLNETIEQARLRAQPGVSEAQWADYLERLDFENRRFSRSISVKSTALEEARAVRKALDNAGAAVAKLGPAAVKATRPAAPKSRPRKR